METIQEKRGKRFFIGVVFITVSFILGWPVLFFTVPLSVLYGRFWFAAGIFIYVTSWIMLGVGFLMAGKEGYRFIKEKGMRCGK